MINILGARQFDQCVINMALIHLCNQVSYVSQEMQRQFKAWKNAQNEAIVNPWHDLHQFTIYVPHPDQDYEGLTLEAGLTQGYNIEVKPVFDRSQIPYQIPEGGQFVVVLKQIGLNAGFNLAATGIFIRPLAVLALDIIVDADKPEYQSILVQHPIIRDYPSGLNQTVQKFLNHELQSDELPQLVRYVDQAINPDYHPPTWPDVHLAAKGFAGV